MSSCAKRLDLKDRERAHSFFEASGFLCPALIDGQVCPILLLRAFPVLFSDEAGSSGFASSLNYPCKHLQRDPQNPLSIPVYSARVFEGPVRRLACCLLVLSGGNSATSIGTVQNKTYGG